jgi:hypothetical protein
VISFTVSAHLIGYRCQTSFDSWGWNGRSKMAAIARTVSPGVQVNVEALNVVVVCGVALTASLLLFIWSAHLGPASTVALGVMNWI